MFEKPVFSDVFCKYVVDAGYAGDQVPKELVLVGEQFAKIRQGLNTITFGEVADGLGSDTPHTESGGYFPIGMIVVKGAIGYCELGALIASDPKSTEVYGSTDKVTEVAVGFLEEAQGTLRPSFLYNDCPAINTLAQSALGILRQIINPESDTE